jgi:hypothetical protein
MPILVPGRQTYSQLTGQFLPYYIRVLSQAFAIKAGHEAIVCDLCITPTGSLVLPPTAQLTVINTGNFIEGPLFV